jgi:putative ABC transport system permease protein
MIRNYLKVTVRNFIGQKYYSIINTAGLALGLAACILILLFVQDELSFEKDFKNNGKIFRLTQDFPMGNHLSRSATVPFPTKNTMLEDFSEISHASWIFRPSSWGNTLLLEYEDDIYYEDDFVYADHSFLDIYDLKFIQGDPQTALTGPNELILTASTAKKYFGDDDAIGKRLRLNDFRDLEVIAVIEDLPYNTHLHFNIIASFETFKSFFNNPAFFDTQWVWVAAWMYFTVDQESAIERIKSEMPEFVKRHYPEVLVEKGVVLNIQNASDIHLNSNLELEFEPNGNISHVYLFSAIAVLILLIAVINFMNLSTSRSTRRAKEVGLRKVMGANRRMLISQFIGEAYLTCVLAMFIAIILIIVVLPWFNNLTLLIGLILLVIVVGFLSGSYPAFVLSSFNPNEVIKGNVSKYSGSGILRKILVISQFVVSISLMICIGIVLKQLNYIQNKNLGFNSEQILIADMNFNFFNKYGSFKNELEKNTDIKAVSMLGGSIPGESMIMENAFVESGSPTEEQQWFSSMSAWHDMNHIMDIEFLKGHSFKVGSSVDSSGFIINESAVKALGWDQLNSNNGSVMQTGTVIGIVKDFDYRPLYEKIKPLVIRFGGGKLCIKIQSNNLNTAILQIENVWNEQFEGTPFRYSFMDDNFNTLYQKEHKFSKTIQYFSLLAIFIACLGLLGLSSYATENRKKEIGIRKVNGASVYELIKLLTKDFSKLIFIAYMIAIPIAYYAGTLWLENFAYQTEMGFYIFIVSGLIALIVAFLTIGYHTLRAALKNPVDAIRYE